MNTVTSNTSTVQWYTFCTGTGGIASLVDKK